MRLGERLKQVVAANFIEISRDEATEAATAAAAAGVVPTPESPSTGPDKANHGYTNSADAVVVAPVSGVVGGATAEAAPVGEAPGPAVVVKAVVDHDVAADVARWFEGRNTLAVEYAGVLASDGAPDFDRLFQNADLPPVSCSADEAVKILAEMPGELPMRVRRITARATVDRLSQASPEALQDILSDASLKMVKVARLVEKTAERAGELKQGVEEEIAALEAEIARRRAVLAQVDERQEQVRKACRTRMGELNDVVLFFDHPDVAAAKEAVPVPQVEESASPQDELPPFMRDDSVMRMLGIRGGKDIGGEAVAETAPDERTAAESRRSGAGRRKTAVGASAED